MLIAALVIAHRTLLNALGSRVQINMYLSVRAPFRGQHAQFNGIQRSPGISSGNIRQKFPRVVIQNYIVSSQSPLFVIDGTDQKFLNIFFLKGFQLKDHGTGKKRAVDFKIGIFCGSADQDHRPVLHKRKQIILLSLIEAVDLINKQNRFLSVHTKQILRLVHRLFHIFFSRRCRIELPEFRTGRIGDHFCQRCLPCARRSVKNNGAQLIRLDRPVQQPSLPDDMFLTDNFLQCLRTHP